MTVVRQRLWIGMVVLLTSLPATADDQPSTDRAEGLAFFESKVRPVLIRHCYECHSAESGASEGELRVDTRNSIRRGGGRGHAVVPGRPEASLLLTAISHRDSDLEMPPDKPRLPEQVIADLRKWIEMGAPDPREEQPFDETAWPGEEAAALHWAYQPPEVAPPPDVGSPGWPRDTVDHFILARLESEELFPSADAEPHTLLRRLYFDLVGLPPSPAELAKFLASADREGVDTALASRVDELLATPQFGERWGRHWLDVARYGESSGGESNISFPYAWRYRDYVIDAVNADVPYDRFLTEQIAGDLLPYDSAAERARLLIATGFLALGPKNLGEANELQFQADIVDEQIDALSRAVLASSIACARCHRHKFDPFTMEDYYGLAGIFASTKTYFGTFTSPANRRSGDPLPLPRVEGQQLFHESLPPSRFEELKNKLADLEAEWEEMEAAKRALFAGQEPEKRFTLRDVLANIWRRGPIEGKLETLDDTGAAIPLAMGTLDRERIVDVPLLARGELSRPGEIVPRAFPASLALTDQPEIPGNQSGRLQLARWLTHQRHPLTSRVFVNRVWHHLFGAGLVSTVDNFGTTGEMPSHPQLLDTLAVEFQEAGWSLKWLVRRLVLSRTYRQASAFDPRAFEQDPENRLLWRMPKRRLQAEAIRDAMLTVSGELDLSRPDGSLVARSIGDRPISLIGLNAKLPGDLDGSVHRSVYLPVIRDRLPDVLDLFDFAEPSLVTGSRDTTNVPVQALYLMNSSFVQERARGFASRLSREASTTNERIDLAFRLCYARPPASAERQRAGKYLDSRQEGAEAADDSLLLEAFCQALFSTAEFRNLD